ncbi:MAG: GLPGLI family protein [Tannerella sp.]|jgi:GLPGLI family protein|nr:GLPGLI family protein [Tannerella sp.]
MKKILNLLIVALTGIKAQVGEKAQRCKYITCAVIFLALSSGMLNAQTLGRHDFSKVEVLDKAVFTCRYEQIITSDSVRNNRNRTVMLLEVGDNLSKYFDEKCSKDRQHERTDLQKVQHTIDSIRSLGKNPVTAVPPYALFRNYQEKKVTVIEMVFPKILSYDEDLEALDWKLQDDTATVNGYSCRKATTAFRGRNYEAWYAPEIPISEGPWKFYGLPGLIFKVIDSNGHFSYECISFKYEDKTIDIYKDNKSVIKTTQAEAKKLKKAYKDDPEGIFAANGVTFRAAEGNTLPVITVLPIELE